ncbi:NAD(P)-dependent oxidoreductase [Candidatus Woesearchaeota archaeon]|nr:NAD(P)-dependent oxidoreductase [Candidatus Woesearchaeota archaeon]
MTRVLVTGAVGFLGSNFIEILRQTETYITGVVRNLVSLSTPRPACEIGCAFGDLTKPENCLRVTQQQDLVIHCAAHTAGAMTMKNDPTSLVTQNNLMNNHLLEAAGKNGVKHFVFISSSAVYPESELPLKEEDGMKGDPPSIYQGVGWMKRYGEQQAKFFGQHYGMQVYIVRPTQLAGLYDKFDEAHSHMIPGLIARAMKAQKTLEVWGHPDASRDFMYVQDFCRAVLKMVELNLTGPINIGSGFHYKTEEIVQDIIEYVHRSRGISLTPVYNPNLPQTVRARFINTDLARQHGLMKNTSSLSQVIDMMMRQYEQQQVPA